MRVRIPSHAPRGIRTRPHAPYEVNRGRSRTTAVKITEFLQVAQTEPVPDRTGGRALLAIPVAHLAVLLPGRRCADLIDMDVDHGEQVLPPMAGPGDNRTLRVPAAVLRQMRGAALGPLHPGTLELKLSLEPKFDNRLCVRILLEGQPQDDLRFSDVIFHQHKRKMYEGVTCRCTQHRVVKAHYRPGPGNTACAGCG